MTTLQEALDKCERVAIESGAWEAYKACRDAFAELRTALAQQELPQKVRPDFMAGYDAGMADAKRMAQHREQQPVCHGCGIPAGDVHMSTCKSGKWPSRVSNGDTAAPVPQTAPVAWVWNPASIEWEKVRAFGHWQQGALYAFGPTQPEPLAAPAPQAQEPCPNGEPCKHGAWCTEVYCQELCEFRNQPAPQP